MREQRLFLGKRRCLSSACAEERERERSEEESLMALRLTAKAERKREPAGNNANGFRIYLFLFHDFFFVRHNSKTPI